MVQQTLQAVYRIHAYRIHVMCHLHDVLPAMNPSSCSHVQCVGISHTVVAINDYTAGYNKRCRLCTAFTHTVSMSCITYMMYYRA